MPLLLTPTRCHFFSCPHSKLTSNAIMLPNLIGYIVLSGTEWGQYFLFSLWHGKSRNWRPAATTVKWGKHFSSVHWPSPKIPCLQAVNRVVDSFLTKPIFSQIFKDLVWKDMALWLGWGQTNQCFANPTPNVNQKNISLELVLGEYMLFVLLPYSLISETNYACIDL